MTKNEFLKELERKLEILDPSEVKDIIDEYSEHIDEKLKKEKNEEKVISELGNINEIASDILDAYKINKNFKKEGKADEFFNNIVDGAKDVFNKFATIFSSGNSNAIANLILYIFIILLVILVIRIPFSIIEDLLLRIVYNFMNPLKNVFVVFIELFINLSYLIIAFIVFIKLMKEKMSSMNFETEVNMKKEEKNTVKESKKETPEKEVIKAKKETIEKEVVDVKKENNKEAKESVIKEKALNETINEKDTPGYVLKLCVKVMCGFFAVPLLFTTVGMLVLLAVLVEFSIKYFLVIGACVAVAGVILGLILAIQIIFKFIFDKRIKFGGTFVTLLISLVFLGFGIGYAIYEVADVDFIEIDYSYTQSQKFEYEVRENMNIYCDSCESLRNTIKIDNSLGSKVIIEILYKGEMVNINESIGYYFDEERNNNNSVHFYSSVKSIDYIKLFTENLKDKKISDLSNLDEIKMIIHASESTIPLLDITNY